MHIAAKQLRGQNYPSPSSEGEVAERSEVDGGAVPVGPCLTPLHPHLASPSEEGEE